MNCWLIATTLFAFWASLVSGSDDLPYQESTFKLLLDHKIWSKFFESYKLKTRFKSTLDGSMYTDDVLTLVRPEKINSDKFAKLDAVLSHTMTDYKTVKLTVTVDRVKEEFTLHVGTTTSDCKVLPMPYGDTCMRAADYRIYSDSKPIIMHTCIMIFYPAFRSGGKFCYKMYPTGKKISLNFNTVVVSAAGDDKQAVYLNVAKKPEGWKVLKIVD